MSEELFCQNGQLRLKKDWVFDLVQSLAAQMDSDVLNFQFITGWPRMLKAQPTVLPNALMKEIDNMAAFFQAWASLADKMRNDYGNIFGSFIALHQKAPSTPDMTTGLQTLINTLVHLLFVDVSNLVSLSEALVSDISALDTEYGKLSQLLESVKQEAAQLQQQANMEQANMERDIQAGLAGELVGMIESQQMAKHRVILQMYRAEVPKVYTYIAGYTQAAGALQNIHGELRAVHDDLNSLKNFINSDLIQKQPQNDTIAGIKEKALQRHWQTVSDEVGFMNLKIPKPPIPDMAGTPIEPIDIPV